MPKIKNIIISDRVKTNMGGIRVQNPILSKESIDEGTLDEAIGLDSGNTPVRGSTSGESDSSLKIGVYIVNEEIGKLEWVEEVPEDYTGISFYFGDDMFEISSYNDGVINYTTTIGSGSITTPLLIADIIDFSKLTHSFNELDPTLKQIVEDAICDGGINGVACTQAQWSAIKSLLDKSLYINYSGYSMIKTMTDGISIYSFGMIGEHVGSKLEINYDSNALLLFVNYAEL